MYRTLRFRSPIQYDFSNASDGFLQALGTATIEVVRSLSAVPTNANFDKSFLTHVFYRQPLINGTPAAGLKTTFKMFQNIFCVVLNLSNQLSSPAGLRRERLIDLRKDALACESIP